MLMSDLKIELNKTVFSNIDDTVEGVVILQLSGVMEIAYLTVEIIATVIFHETNLRKVLFQKHLVASPTEFRPGTCRLPFLFSVSNECLPPTLSCSSFKSTAAVSAKATTVSPFNFEMVDMFPIVFRPVNFPIYISIVGQKTNSDPFSSFCCGGSSSFKYFVEAKYPIDDKLLIRLTVETSGLSKSYKELRTRIYGELMISEILKDSLFIHETTKSIKTDHNTTETMLLEYPPFDLSFDGIHIKLELILEVEVLGSLLMKDIREKVKLLDNS